MAVGKTLLAQAMESLRDIAARAGAGESILFQSSWNRMGR